MSMRARIPIRSADETVWLTRVADEDGLPSAIVARVELDHPAVEAQLAWQVAQPRVKGIRHLINWHPTDPSRRAYDRDLTRDPRWRAGFALLGRHELSYDFHGFPRSCRGWPRSLRNIPRCRSSSTIWRCQFRRTGWRNGVPG